MPIQEKKLGRWRRLREVLASAGLSLLAKPKIGGHSSGGKRADQIGQPPEDWMERRQMIGDLVARLHEMAVMDKCVCGDVKGHVGWLLCAFPRRDAIHEGSDPEPQSRHNSTGPVDG